MSVLSSKISVKKKLVLEKIYGILQLNIFILLVAQEIEVRTWKDVGDWRQSKSVAEECQRLENLSLNS